MRKYKDPNLEELRGMVFDASLIYAATGLTTVTLTGSSKADEIVVAGVSGVLRRDVGLQVDHAFRRWLIGTLKIGYGLDDYTGSIRVDNRMSLGSAITTSSTANSRSRASTAMTSYAPTSRAWTTAPMCFWSV